jgi:hypothetical protein
MKLTVNFCVPINMPSLELNNIENNATVESLRSAVIQQRPELANHFVRLVLGTTELINGKCLRDYSQDTLVLTAVAMQR